MHKPEDPSDEIEQLLILRLEEHKKREELYVQYLHELKTKKKFVDYFSQFSYWKNDLENYAWAKSHWMTTGEENVKKQKRIKRRWWRFAFECLKQIQQKKLFDLQCQWRAERIQLKGVELCFDFELWSKDILSCPFLPKVTEEEVGLYIRYLSEVDISKRFITEFPWQNYALIRASYLGQKGNKIYRDSWYHYHNEITGNDLLFAMKDIRGEREAIYLNPVPAEDDENEDVLTETKTMEPQKPVLRYEEFENMDSFVRNFDTIESLVGYKAMKLCSSKVDLPPGMNADAGLFEEERNSYVSIESHADWRIAFAQTAETYKRKHTIEKLPQAFQHYLKHPKSKEFSYPFKLEDHFFIALETEVDYMKFQFKVYDNAPIVAEAKRKRTEIANEIINRRIWLGEPADLNF